MPSEDKVLRLVKIAVDLRKKVTQMEEQRRPSTPPEVLESRRDAATQAVKRIEEAEKTCAKVVDQVSYTWESLIDDK